MAQAGFARVQRMWIRSMPTLSPSLLAGGSVGRRPGKARSASHALARIVQSPLTRYRHMAKLKDVTKSVATRAKAGQKAVKAAVKSASKAVSKAKADTSRAVTKARAGASKLAAKAAVKLAPTPSRKKKVARALVAAGAVVGAAAVAAASVSAARSRKQR
jgi:hypothetical protein